MSFRDRFIADMKKPTSANWYKFMLANYSAIAVFLLVAYLVDNFDNFLNHDKIIYQIAFLESIMICLGFLQSWAKRKKEESLK